MVQTDAWQFIPKRFYEENSIIKFYFELAEKSSIPILFIRCLYEVGMEDM